MTNQTSTRTHAQMEPQGTPSPNAGRLNAVLPTTDMINTPVNEQEAFQEAWSFVDAVLVFCLQNDPPAIKNWFDANRYITTYTMVYKYCVAPRTTVPDEPVIYFHGEKLYRRLEERLTELFSQIGEQLKGSDTVIPEYNTYADRLAVMLKHVEAIFMYIERHWVERAIQQFQRRQTAPVVYRTKQMILLKWEEFVIRRCVEKIMAQVKLTLDQERQLGMADFNSHIQRLFGAFHMASAKITPMITNKEEDNKVAVFSTFISPFYLDSLKVSCDEASAKIGDLDQFKQKYDLETKRAEFYFSNCQSAKENMLKEVNHVLKEHLFQPCGDLIKTVFDIALMSGDAVKCGEVFSMLSAQEEMMGQLDASVGRFCSDQLARLPQQRVDVFLASILSVHRSITDFIQTALHNRQSMLSARDTAFRTFMKQGNNGDRIDECLAIRLDQVIRDELRGATGGNKKKSSSNVSVHLDDIMALFKLLDDKQSFKKHHSTLMANRLLLSSEAGKPMLAMEHQVVKALLSICGVGYVSGLQKMLSDVERREGTDMKSFSILTSGSWPLSLSSQTVTWPEEMASELGPFAKEYCTKNKKQKLEWIPSVSTVCVSVSDDANSTGGKKKSNEKTIKMTVVQYNVLSPIFAEPEAFHGLDSIKRSCQFSDDVISAELEHACKAGVLKKKETGKKIGYSYNKDCFQDTLLINLADSVECFDSEADFMDIDTGALTSRSPMARSEEDNMWTVKAALVKLAKKARTIALGELKRNVVPHVQKWVPNPSNEMIDTCIDQLVKSDFLQVSKDIVEYLP